METRRTVHQLLAGATCAALIASVGLIPGCESETNCIDAIGFDVNQVTDEGQTPDQGQVVDVPVDTSGTDAEVTIAAVMSVSPYTIDFLYTETDDPRRVLVTVTNTSDAELRINGAFVADALEPENEGLFAVVEDPAFPTTATDGEIDYFPLAVGATRTFHVSYVKLTADFRDVTATLIITYRLPEDGPETLREFGTAMTATHAESNQCELEITGSTGRINFGAIPVGTDTDKTFTFTNSGAGVCTITAFKIADCAVITQESGTAAWDCPAPFAGDDSATYSVTSPESIVGMQIAAGAESDPVTIHLPASVQSGSMLYPALISFEAADDDGYSRIMPQCGADSNDECVYNINATTYVGSVVSQGQGIFGPVRTGCAVTLKSCVLNNGPEVSLNSLTHDSCGSEFTFTGIPETMPATLESNKEFCIDVTYSPVDIGADSCQLAWTVDEETTNLGISGLGTDADQQTDSFTTTEGQVAFDITGTPVAGVAATINGVPCNDGWTIENPEYNATAVAGGSCIPATGDTVVITYDIGCEAP